MKLVPSSQFSSQRRFKISALPVAAHSGSASSHTKKSGRGSVLGHDISRRWPRFQIELRNGGAGWEGQGWDGHRDVLRGVKEGRNMCSLLRCGSSPSRTGPGACRPRVESARWKIRRLGSLPRSSFPQSGGGRHTCKCVSTVSHRDVTPLTFALRLLVDSQRVGMGKYCHHRGVSPGGAE